MSEMVVDVVASVLPMQNSQLGAGHPAVSRVDQTEVELVGEVDEEPKRQTRLVGPIWVDIKQLRVDLDENQERFWGRFGVTQSAGSRYELSARSIPRPVRMLVVAFATKALTEEALATLRRATDRDETEANVDA